MTVIAAQLIRLITEHGVDIVGKSGHNIEQFSFTCCFVISYARLDHMACAIQLMTFCKICPTLSRLLECKIGV
ncbi:hypothetical protein D3C76_1365210 [compost metagenome]